MSYIQGYDPDTLREIVDPRHCSERLEEIGEQRSLPALLERVWLLKVLGRPEDALSISDQSVRVARMALRAYAAAEQELTACADEAEGQGWSAIAAFAYQHRGKVHYDEGDYDSARRDFKSALFLRQESGVPDDQLESTLLAIDAADRRRVVGAVAGSVAS